MGGKMFALYLRAPQFLSLLRYPKAWMYVAVNYQRRSFMASVDGVAEYAFHAAIKPGEDADTWTEKDAKRVFSEAMGADIPIEILSMGTWLAGHALVAEKFQRGRVFIAGDAAHLFTPTGGLGYNTAVEDAVNLAWKLASVIRGHATLTLLDTYEAERRPLAQRNTGYARHFADSVDLFSAKPELDDDSAQGNEERAKASEYLNRHARLEFNIPGVTFGGRYGDSPIIAQDGVDLPPDEPNDYVPTASPGAPAPCMAGRWPFPVRHIPHRVDIARPRCNRPGNRWLQERGPVYGHRPEGGPFARPAVTGAIRITTGIDTP